MHPDSLRLDIPVTTARPKRAYPIDVDFPMSGKKRLDQILVEKGLTASRARARDAILRGHVHVDGRQAGKPGATVSETADIKLSDPAANYVSRSALKLKAGLDRFEFNPSGLACLDLGASTGGFTQVLIERGARIVYAVDVGHDQLHHSLADHGRVVSMEGVNARDLMPAMFPEPLDCLVSDVSFISLRLVLPAALDMMQPGAFGVFLVKPQFEAGRANIGKGGLVKRETGERIAEEMQSWIDGYDGWRSCGLLPSPITGGDGNVEYLLGARRL